MPRVGSLLSGIDLGFSWEGFDPTWFADFEQYGATILREK